MSRNEREEDRLRDGREEEDGVDEMLPGSMDVDEEIHLGAYVDFLKGIPSENAIAKRFVTAAHLLARGVLVNTVFSFIRGLEFNWEESVTMTGDVLSMSRSTVARSVRDVDRILAFWKANGYQVADLEDVVAQISDLTKHRIAEALEEKAHEDDDRS